MTTPAEKTPAEKYREQNVYEDADRPEPDWPAPGTRAPSRLATHADLQRRVDEAKKFVTQRLNDDGGVTLLPCEARQLMRHLSPND